MTLLGEKCHDANRLNANPTGVGRGRYQHQPRKLEDSGHVVSRKGDSSEGSACFCPGWNAWSNGMSLDVKVSGGAWEPAQLRGADCACLSPAPRSMASGWWLDISRGGSICIMEAGKLQIGALSFLRRTGC